MTSGGIIFKPPGMGGAERYVAFLSEIFDFPLHVLYSDVNHGAWIDEQMVHEFGEKPALPVLGRRVGGSFLDRMEYAFWKPPKEYDVVLSSGLVSKATVHYPHQTRVHLAIGVHQGAFGIPPRDVFSSNAFVKALQKANRALLRDQEASHLERGDAVVAQSEPTADIIEFYLGVKPDAVINPPVAVNSFHDDRPADEDIYLYVGGLHVYKQLDTVVEAFDGLDERLVVAGDGAEREKLERMAGDNIEFLGYVSEERKRELLARCEAVIQNHEFGVATVEALAAGAPVIAVDHRDIRNTQLLHLAAYSADIIDEGVNGIYFEDSNEAEPIRDAVRRAEATDWDHAAIQETAKPYSFDRIERQWRAVVRDASEGA